MSDRPSDLGALEKHALDAERDLLRMVTIAFTRNVSMQFFSGDVSHDEARRLAALDVIDLLDRASRHLSNEYVVRKE